MIRDADRLLTRLRDVHDAIRERVVDACERAAHQLETLSSVVAVEGGDTVYAIDRVSEDTLLTHFDVLAREWPMLLVAEGLGKSGRRILPAGAIPEIAVIVDPIDGTRGLMYQKRPGWILTGVAPYRRDREPTLADIALALQTEIPLVKQHLCDSLWVTSARQVQGERLNRLTGERTTLLPHPSGATTIEQGFGNLARFFPGPRALLAAIDDAIVERIVGPISADQAASFEDQYISSAGQLYELMMGHDRWTADVRPLVWTARGERGLCCHPYDLCTALIATTAGVIVTGARGEPLDAPFDVHADVAWAGYANRAIQAQVEPALQALLREHGLA